MGEIVDNISITNSINVGQVILQSFVTSFICNVSTKCLDICFLFLSLILDIINSLVTSFICNVCTKSLEISSLFVSLILVGNLNFIFRSLVNIIIIIDAANYLDLNTVNICFIGNCCCIFLTWSFSNFNILSALSLTFTLSWMEEIYIFIHFHKYFVGTISLNLLYDWVHWMSKSETHNWSWNKYKTKQNKSKVTFAQLI